MIVLSGFAEQRYDLFCETSDQAAEIIVLEREGRGEGNNIQRQPRVDTCYRSIRPIHIQICARNTLVHIRAFRGGEENY